VTMMNRIILPSPKNNLTCIRVQFRKLETMTILEPKGVQ
jgi:hypothetical protein